MAEPARQSDAPRKPKMLIAIEHLDGAEAHMNSAMNVLSAMILDLQKGADFIRQYKQSLVETFEDAGGDPTAAIEHQIKEFIPKHVIGSGNNNAGSRES